MVLAPHPPVWKAAVLLFPETLGSAGMTKTFLCLVRGPMLPKLAKPTASRSCFAGDDVSAAPSVTDAGAASLLMIDPARFVIGGFYIPTIQNGL
jgi:hypothetical protein